jgi:hypothetical protein
MTETITLLMWFTRKIILGYLSFSQVRVSYGSHNKQRLFPQTALTGLAL